MDPKLLQNSDESVRCLLLACCLAYDFAKTDNLLLFKELLARGPSLEPLIDEVVRKLTAGIDQAIWTEACKTLDQARDLDVELLSPFWSGYPSELLDLPDPPALLFLRGSLASSCRVAIVGARRCSSYGLRIAQSLGRTVRAAGGTVVSGLALGIDTAAHRGALEGDAAAAHSSSPAVAVLGSGVYAVHPRSNQRLADEILASGGALLSEYGLYRTPRKHYYPRRNRIISGLSKKVVIVEAAERSGSLITARLALEQGRDVATIPGSIFSPTSRGCNRLIQDGAEVLLRAEDLLAGLPELAANPSSRREKAEPRADLLLSELGLPDEQHRAAAALLTDLASGESLTVDQLQAKTAFSAEQLRQLLGRLELHGLIRSLDGGYALGERIDNC